MFRIQDRGQRESLVLVRGWAFDNLVFGSLELPFNYVFYEGTQVSNFAADLTTWLEHTDTVRIHLLGWSMGAYAVGDAALMQANRIGQVLLVGARQRYPSAEVDVVRAALHRNRRGFMRKFYKDCYAGHDHTLYRDFKQTLLPDYLDRWPRTDLERDLDWICARDLDTDALDRVVDLSIIHGANDRIVPADEARALATGMLRGRFISVSNAGHLPFLVPDFQARLYAAL